MSRYCFVKSHAQKWGHMGTYVPMRMMRNTLLSVFSHYFNNLQAAGTHHAICRQIKIITLQASKYGCKQSWIFFR